MQSLHALADLLGRILISLIFLVSGINKITGYSGTQQYMESQGVPGELLPLVIITEVLGAAMVILGVYARWAALGLAGFCVLSALFFHMDFGNQTQQIMFMKNLAIAGGFLAYFANGAGRLRLGKP